MRASKFSKSINAVRVGVALGSNKDKNKSKKPVVLATDSEILNNVYRLQTEDVVPSHYTICIKPNFDDWSFEGCVSVNLKIKKEIKYISMNAIDMNITKIMWEEDITENKQEPMEYFIDVEKQILKMYFEPPLLPNFGYLRVNFNSLISSKMIGLYRSKYTKIVHDDDVNPDDVDNVSLVNDGNLSEASQMSLDATAQHGPPQHDKIHVQEYYQLITKFEPTYARMCFPCWDEPNFKCTFDLSLILPKTLTAISNMPVKLTYPHRTKSHLHIVEFERTPLMSTYLLAFAIGTFDYVELKVPITVSIPSLADPTQMEDKPSQIPVRVYTVPGKQEYVKFALDTCVKLLTFYIKYFDFPYPLPKLDLLAVPEFITGGNESWGLMMFKETRLLLNEHEQTFNSHQRVAILIAHELAQQWIGGIASLEWWTNLWLAKGFATYMEFIAIDHLFPTYDIWTIFYTNTILEMLDYDGLKNSHALEIPVFNPSEIKENFDHISYDKGACLFSMLQHLVGERKFRKAISVYLQKCKYKNANSSLMWKCFEVVTSHKSIDPMMFSWAKKQMGFPLVRVIKTSWNDNVRTITLTQEKFWSDGTQRESRVLNKDFLWTIPITIATGSNPTKVIKEVLMERRMLNITIPNMPKNQWFKLNPGGIGYYRVKYLPEMVMQFHQSIRNRTMPPLDRIGILNDLFAFAQSGLNSMLEIFNLLEAYGEEDNYSVWVQIVEILDRIGRLLWDVEYFDKFHIFYRMFLNTVSEKIGWQIEEDEDPSKMKLRALILSKMVLSDHDETLTIAEQKFRQHISGEEIAPTQLRFVLYQAAFVRGSPTDTLKLLIKKYKETESIEEKECIIHSFNAILDQDLLHDILEFSKSEFVRPFETLQIIKIIASSRFGRDVAWAFFKVNQNLLKTLYSPGVAYTKLVQAVTENFTTDAKAVEVHEYFKDKFSHPGLERTILQIEEKIRINEAWLKREAALIQDYFSTYE